ncbi:hypothetical protein [Saliphagus infecundisoli]|uniref:AtpZ/AtpI family protein n=1 Tax=Saliphagus infecundisoli TaxID=1849069 RepID=A0ABD5QAC3_9EURY|nr:hypothetical protein [Saliphagus infecundisoli]
MTTELAEESRESDLARRVERWLESPLLVVALGGIALLVAGVLKGDGIVAGMFGIYGATALLVSAVAYVVLAILRRNQ